MTIQKVEYMCGVGYWQHNTGSGQCGPRCIQEPFSNFKLAQDFHERMTKLLSMEEYSKEKDHLITGLEVELSLDSVTFQSVSIFKRTTLTTEQDIIDPSKYVE